MRKCYGKLSQMSLDKMKEDQRLFNEACSNGDMDIVDSMLATGFDVNFFHNGINPLGVACKHFAPWTIDLVTKLIIHGANVDSENYLGWSAMDHCLGVCPFQPHVASLVLDCSKIGINRLDKQGRSYLWAATTLEACKFLVENDIDINHVSNHNHTCIDRHKSWEATDYLLTQGAKRYSEL